MRKKILTLLLAACALFQGASAEAPKRELRSTWLATVWAIDWPASHNQTAAKQQLINFLDGLASHNFNGVPWLVA